MVATLLSPNADNYYIGRGILWWKNTTLGLTTWRDLGNAPVFQLKPAIKNLDHFSSRNGLKLKDQSVAIEANATAIMKLDEWTRDNLALALMGTEGVNPFPILSYGVIQGEIFFLGTNTIGAKFSLHLPIVNMTPTNTTLDFISADKFGEIDLTGDVLADPLTGFFGTAEWGTTATAPP